MEEIRRKEMQPKKKCFGCGDIYIYIYTDSLINAECELRLQENCSAYQYDRIFSPVSANEYHFFRYFITISYGIYGLFVTINCDFI
jgi:hypothetical protein